MTAEQILCRYDLQRFQWTQFISAEGLSTHKRQLCGGEHVQDLNNRLLNGETTILFFGTSLSLETPMTEAHLLAAVRNAWISLRFSVPTIAATIEVDEEGISSMVYRAEDQGAVGVWTDRTFCVHRGVGLEGLRRQLGLHPIPSQFGDFTWLHFIPEEVDEQGIVSGFSLLFHTHHALFDGVGAKNVMIRLISQLAQLSGDPREESLEWGRETSNLPPAAFSVLSPHEATPIPMSSAEQPTFERLYYTSINAFMTSFGAALGKSYHLNLPQWDGAWPAPWREEMMLSASETDAVLHGLKRLDQLEQGKFTVTHLAHAALAMVVISERPPQPADIDCNLSNFNVMNCRSRLREPYSARGHYPAYALGILMLNIPLSIFFSTGQQLLAMNGHTLQRVMDVMKRAHEAHRALPAALSYMAQISEIFGSAVKQASESDSKYQDLQSYWFVSDGIGENEMDPTFTNYTSKHTIVRVKHIFTSVNRCHSAPAFRASSWNGRISLSADFNANLVPVADVKRYLEKWKEFITLIT
ncbi:hypothetical protein DFH09DRAFT_1149274 [Mycena vulgaris]|nr:hypothetical protein DFH09DRAFT_1149274 [Mycena vulgaris]